MRRYIRSDPIGAASLLTFPCRENCSFLARCRDLSGSSPDSEIVMKKVRTSVFLLIGVLMHFGLTAAIVGSRLTCDDQIHCISPLNEFAGSILSFPLGTVVWVMHKAGMDPTVLTDAIWGGNILVLCCFNSILAVALAWYAVIKPKVRR